jgi:hypothetical protein
VIVTIRSRISVFLFAACFGIATLFFVKGHHESAWMLLIGSWVLIVGRLLRD